MSQDGWFQHTPQKPLDLEEFKKVEASVTKFMDGFTNWVTKAAGHIEAFAEKLAEFLAVDTDGWAWVYNAWGVTLFPEYVEPWTMPKPIAWDQPFFVDDIFKNSYYDDSGAVIYSINDFRRIFGDYSPKSRFLIVVPRWSLPEGCLGA